MRWDGKKRSKSQWMQNDKDMAGLLVARTCFSAKQWLLLSLDIHRSCCRYLFRCCGCQPNVTCAVGSSSALWSSPGRGHCSPDKCCGLIHRPTASRVWTLGADMPFSMAGLPQQGNYLVFSEFEMHGKKNPREQTRVPKGIVQCLDHHTGMQVFLLGLWHAWPLASHTIFLV